MGAELKSSWSLGWFERIKKLRVFKVLMMLQDEWHKT